MLVPLRHSLLVISLVAVVASKRCASTRSRRNNNNIKTVFEGDEIVGDILDEAPQYQLQVKFGCSRLNPGDQLIPSAAAKEPVIGQWKSSKDKLYTLISLDPDALSRKTPQYRSVVHWLVTNIPGDLKSKGDIIIPYFGPGPPKDTGFHRYVFLVFEQTSGSISVDNLQHTEYMGKEFVFNFNLREFIEMFKLSTAPIAGNYFQSAHAE